MIIRHATEQDIDAVKRVSDSLQVSRDQEGWEKATSGLFEYPKTREELLKALNPHFLVDVAGPVADANRGFAAATSAAARAVAEPRTAAAGGDAAEFAERSER